MFNEAELAKISYKVGLRNQQSEFHKGMVVCFRLRDFRCPFGKSYSDFNLGSD